MNDPSHFIVLYVNLLDYRAAAATTATVAVLDHQLIVMNVAFVSIDFAKKKELLRSKQMLGHLLRRSCYLEPLRSRRAKGNRRTNVSC